MTQESYILSRRSVRDFLPLDVSDQVVNQVLEAGRWAPSGLNNQPWRFKVVRDKEVLRQLASLTHYSGIISSAPVSIAVFLDNEAVYDREKDLLAVGACIENMLLSCHSLGLGAVWLGEILKNKEKVREILKAPESFELCAVVSLGHPKNPGSSERKPLEDLLF